MANLSDLDLINEAGDTKSQYTLLKNHAIAIERASKKAFFVDDVELSEPLEDGGCYFVKTTATGRTYNLPAVADSVNVEIFIQHLTGAAGVAVVTAAVDEYILLPGGLLSLASGYDLDTAGDYLHLICDGTSWYAIGYAIA